MAVKSEVSGSAFPRGARKGLLVRSTRPEVALHWEAKHMLKRIVLVTCLLLGCTLAGAALAATDGTHQVLALLAVEPANADASVDGIATFGGVMPASSRLDGMRALGLRVQGLQNLPLALLR